MNGGISVLHLIVHQPTRLTFFHNFTWKLDTLIPLTNLLTAP